MPSAARRLLRKMRAGGEVALAVAVGRRSPLIVSWALTDICNLSCSYCGRWDRGSREIPAARMLEIACEMADAGVARVGLTGGEPLLHPQCLPIAETLARAGVKVSLNTNGARLPRYVERIAAAVSSVTISLDGGRDTHDALRGAGSWDRAIEASYVARAAGLEVSLKMVVTRTNAALSEIEAVLAAAGAVGGKAGFSPLEETPALGRRDLAPLWPAAEAWREVVDDLIRKKLAGDERVETSIAGLQYLRNWPVHAEIRCSAGVIYARIEPDGRLFGCGNLVRSGVHASLVDTPFADAFRAIGPGGCDSCWCDTRVEMNLVLGGSPSAIRAAVSR